jgi:hypothetical protein
MTRQTVVSWLTRYLRSRVAGLHVERCPERPRTIDHAANITETLEPVTEQGLA